MGRSFSIIFVVGVMLGGVIGFTTASTQSSNIHSQLDSLQSELQSLAQDLSAYRQLDKNKLSLRNSDEGQLHSEWDQNKLLSEIQTLVYDVVNESLHDALNDVNQTKLVKAQYATELKSSSKDSKMESGVDIAVAQESMVIAEGVITAAIARGVWTQEDSTTYQKVLHTLSGEAIHETNRKLAIAINNGEIEIDNSVQLFLP